MNNLNHLEIGKKGELLASRFLLEKGYEILKCRWTYKHKEIDIIAKQNDVLVIVEVKARSNDKFTQPEEAVDLKKQRFLFEAAEAFIQDYTDFTEVRFDIIAIILKQGEYTIHHIENAFEPL
ncbi:MAG: YraN family protein [Bacteroidales bacterium]